LRSAAVVVSSAASVTTDKSDYHPGEVVTITGAGWQPGEAVSLVIHEEPTTFGDVALSAVADASGHFANTDYSPEVHDAGFKYTLTAMGQASGFVAQTTFSDTTLNTFEDAAETISRDAFAWGATVYAKMTGVDARPCWKIDWKTPSGTTKQTDFLTCGGGSSCPTIRHAQFVVPSGPSGVWTADLSQPTTAATDCTTVSFNAPTTTPFDVARAVVIGAIPTGAVGGDNFVDQHNPTMVQGSPAGAGTELDVQSQNNSNNRRTFLRFQLTGSGVAGTVNSAKLRLFPFNTPSNNRTYNIDRVTATWLETTITWNNQPGVAGSPTSTMPMTANTNLVLVRSGDLASDVAAVVIGTLTNFRWR